MAEALLLASSGAALASLLWLLWSLRSRRKSERVVYDYRAMLGALQRAQREHEAITTRHENQLRMLWEKVNK